MPENNRKKDRRKRTSEHTHPSKTEIIFSFPEIIKRNISGKIFSTNGLPLLNLPATIYSLLCISQSKIYSLMAFHI
jgi:hypothetical protein